MKKFVKPIIIFLFVAAIAFSATYLVLPSIKVDAYTGIPNAPTGQALLSAANTYDCMGVTAQPLSQIKNNSRNFYTPYSAGKNGQGDVVLDNGCQCLRPPDQAPI